MNSQAITAFQSFPDDVREDLMRVIQLYGSDKLVLKKRVADLLSNHQKISSFNRSILIQSLDEVVFFLSV